MTNEFVEGNEYSSTNRTAGIPIDMINNEFIEGEYVYVSDKSVQHALKSKAKRIYLQKLDLNVRFKYICVYWGDEEKYKNGEEYSFAARKYIVKIPKAKVTIELTPEQLEQVKHLLDN